jgi:MFS transporter, DHA2 family, multidrug resistance protein
VADTAPNDLRPINRPAITLCVILAVIMQALDTTIANVALPYMQGSVSASADQIMLTSYIVAAAIMTPPSGFLANRFGRKRILMVAVVGFVIASVLCGIAQSLVQIVAFRLRRDSSAQRWFRLASPFCSTSIRWKNAGLPWPCSAYR